MIGLIIWFLYSTEGLTDPLASLYLSAALAPAIHVANCTLLKMATLDDLNHKMERGTLTLPECNAAAGAAVDPHDKTRPPTAAL